MAKKIPAGFKDPRKKAADKTAAPTDKTSMRISKRGEAPMGGMGAMGGMGPMGMKSGGACKGYKKGGAIDGVAKKGHTKGKVC